MECDPTSLVFPEKTTRQGESVWYPGRPLSIKRQDGGGGRDVNVSDRMAVVSLLNAEFSEVRDLVPCAR